MHHWCRELKVPWSIVHFGMTLWATYDRRELCRM